MKLLLINIKELVQVEDKPRKWVAGKEMSRINTIKNAFLLISDEMITDFGTMESLNQCNLENSEQMMEIDCKCRVVFPSFCDPDSHLLYPFSHELELAHRSKKLSKKTIEKSSHEKLEMLRSMSEDELFELALEKVEKIIRKGTGAIEIKSGYGLEPEDEIKMLRIIKRLKKSTPLVITSTFMGDQSIPASFAGKADQYFATLSETILPQIVNENLAENIDIYLNNGYFSTHTAEAFLRMGIKAGLKPKIHHGEIGLSKLRNKTLTQEMNIIDSQFKLKDKIAVISKHQALPIILPGVSFFQNKTSTPVRAMIDAGLPVALGTDYNQGVTPSFDMKFMMSLGIIKHGMTAEEVINAATINSAFAMDISKGYGSIARGKAANLFITEEIPSYQFFPYAYNSDLIEMVILGGEIQ